MRTQTPITVSSSRCTTEARGKRGAERVDLTRAGSIVAFAVVAFAVGVPQGTEDLRQVFEQLMQTGGQESRDDDRPEDRHQLPRLLLEA